MPIARPPLLLLAALALACTHNGERPANTPEERPPASTAPPSPSADGPARATDPAVTTSGSQAEPEDCASAKEGQPCRAPYQHCALSCDDACSPCALLICEDGTWRYQEEFPEPNCGEH